MLYTPKARVAGLLKFYFVGQKLESLGTTDIDNTILIHYCN